MSVALLMNDRIDFHGHLSIVKDGGRTFVPAMPGVEEFMHRYRVLAVEDDPGNNMVLANIFRVSGCIDGVFEEQGERVLDIVRSGEIDLVLMDITLTNSTLGGETVDGLELTRHLKKIANKPPVVLLTAHCMAGDADRFLTASGADAYIAKPLQDIEGFIVWVSLTIEEFRARAAELVA